MTEDLRTASRLLVSLAEAEAQVIHHTQLLADAREKAGSIRAKLEELGITLRAPAPQLVDMRKA